MEAFFGKMGRSFLRRVRVTSKEKLIQRIYRGIDEINKSPVVFKWPYKTDEVATAPV